MPPDDFSAGDDAFTLMKAQEIEKDAGRIAAAKSFAVDEANKAAAMARSLLGVNVKARNNTVSDSKMESK